MSTIVRHGFAPVVIVLDNKGYGTERVLHPGAWGYNEIHGWHYHKIPEMLGGGRGFEVRTERDLDAAVTAAWNSDSMSLIQVHLDRDDSSEALKRLAERLGRIV